MWVKFEHGAPHHPKVVGLSPAAFRAWVEIICWCAGQLTNGIVHRSVPFTAFVRQGSPRKVRDELVAAGLLEERDDGGLAVHDYLHYQPSRESALADKEAARARKVRERARRLAEFESRGLGDV